MILSLFAGLVIRVAEAIILSDRGLQRKVVIRSSDDRFAGPDA
jgi:hypothetical protein